MRKIVKPLKVWKKMKNKLFFLPLVLFSMFGCEQNENSVCYVNNDCEDEYICCLDNLSDERGTCKLADNCVNDGGNNDTLDATD
jgi:hypothetical protein